MIANAERNITRITYDHRNLAQQIVTDTGIHVYVYDEGGRRVGQQYKPHDETSWGVNTRYIYGAYGELLAQYDGASPEYWNILAGGETIGRVDSKERRFYYLKDHLGSIRVTLNQSGTHIGYDDYYPFGLQMENRSYNQGNNYDDQKFTGHFLEQEGGLGIYHAQARMYDPVTGRFWGVDGILQRMSPIELLRYDNAKHLSLSPYVYVRNNPIIYIDPDGLTDWKAIGKGVLQVAGGVTGVVAGVKLKTVAVGAASTGLGAPVGVASWSLGSAVIGLSGANVGIGINNIIEGFKANDGEIAETKDNSVTQISLGLGANETQAELAETGFSLITGGGPFKIGKLFAADKPVQASKQGVVITNHLKNLAESYEKEYLQEKVVEDEDN